MSASPQPVPPESAATNSLGAADIPGFEATEALLQDAVAEADEEETQGETPRQRLAFPPRPDNPPATQPLVPTVHAEESGSENEDDGLGHLAAEDSGSESESDNDAEEAYAPEDGKPKKKSRKSGEKKERKKKENRAERPVEDPEDEDMEPTYDEATRGSSISFVAC
jgi:hypothetical protein